MIDPKFIPEGDFLFQECMALWHQTVAQTTVCSLEETSAMWIMREEAWRAICQRSEIMRTMETYKAKQLMGLPVRITYQDHPDTPMVQLVMEPLRRAPRRAV